MMRSYVVLLAWIGTAFADEFAAGCAEKGITAPVFAASIAAAAVLSAFVSAMCMRRFLHSIKPTKKKDLRFSTAKVRVLEGEADFLKMFIRKEVKSGEIKRIKSEGVEMRAKIATKRMRQNLEKANKIVDSVALVKAGGVGSWLMHFKDLTMMGSIGEGS